MIGDSVDILRHVEKWDGVEAAQVRMGTHAFSYTEKKDITYWYIDSQVRFSLAIRKRPLLLTPATAAKGSRP